MIQKKQVNAEIKTLGPLLDWEAKDCIVSLKTGLAEVQIISLAPDLLRITMVPTGTKLPKQSFAVITEPEYWQPCEWTVEEIDDILRWQSQFTSGTSSQSDLCIEVNQDPFRIAIYRSDGSLVAADAFDGGFSILQEGTQDFAGNRWALQAPANVQYYGFGQKQGFLDKRGQQLSQWATDEPLHILEHDELYQAIPFFLTLDANGRSMGVFIDCTSKVSYDVAKTNSDICVIETPWSTLDAYVFAGPTPKQVIKQYTDLTGRMELPPLWALGYQQCRYSYYPEKRVREVANEMRDREIPCDAIYLDIHYMDGYRVFTWDEERFPDPKQMVEDLSKLGFKVVNIIDPGVKLDGRYEVFQEGIENNHFICYPDGELFVGTVWPGKTVFPDFLREETRHWWADLHSDLVLNVGISGVWNDMNEPSCFARNTLPNDVLQGEDGEQVAHVDVHNVYGLMMSKATYEGLKQLQPDKRQFVLTRSGYAGIQRYAAVWMGDNHSWWEHLHMAIPMCLGMGVSGVSFVGTDIGGFQHDCSGELFARWIQMGSLMPLCRTHTAVDTISQEPWSFGPEVEDISREFLRLRYGLLPFLYNEFYKSSKTGLPIMRPLFLEYPTDQDTYHVSDQYLLGEDLLVCPVYQPGSRKRMVYLPEGEWVDFWTGQHFWGKQHIVADAPLERIPLFVRAGSIIPMEKAVNYTGERDGKELFLHVYMPTLTLNHEKQTLATLELYEDEGEGFGYKDDQSSLTTISLRRKDNTFVLEMQDPQGQFNPLREKVTVSFHVGEDWESLLATERLKIEVKRNVSTQVQATKMSATVGSRGELIIEVATPDAMGFTLEFKILKHL